VQPTAESFQAAASNADWTHAPGYYVILTDQPGERSSAALASVNFT
jgi:phosphate transport system substrate-binding protein